MNGLQHIDKAFQRARSEGRAALMPYFTLGFPTPQDSIEIVEALANAGADLIELGVPFSDPLADGPTIQYSTQVALEQGMTTARCLQLVRDIRARGVRQPLLLMGYVNPILAYGADRYVNEARAAGVDGIIVPDLPIEEAAVLETACQSAELALVYLAAPTSTPQRLASIAQHSTGFLYLVSLTGVTGARETLAEGLEDFVRRARSQAKIPLAVGFGIASPQQAAAVARIADGVIIGSALIHAAGKSDQPARAAGLFLSGIRAVLDRKP